MMILLIFLLDYSQYFYLLELFVFAYLLILSVLKIKNCLKINVLIIKNYASNYKMNIESLKIKTKTNYIWDDTVYIYDIDINSIEIMKRELKIGANIYYIGYVPESYYNNTIKPLYLVINRLFGHIEEIEGSSDRYLVVSTNNRKIIHIFDVLWKHTESEITSNNPINTSFNKIKEYNKLRINSDVDLPIDTLIEFRMLTININCVIEKDNEYYPEIYLDQCLYVKDII